ncbi:MAG: hypothetical protein KC466_08745, partial [Myxococcales bacterium]|nr:hypothetical protein [Myxococcales bacterium]
MRAGENAEQGNFASRARGLALLSILSVVIGVVGGLGAWCLRQLIAVVHNGAFLGHFSFAYDSTLHTPASPLGPFVIAVPFIGAIVVAWIVKNVAPEAKGHGVPEVM